MGKSYKDLISSHSDFPKPGVLFREISPLLFDVKGRKGILEEFGNYMNGKGITAIAGIDARGFLLAGMLAERFQLPLVMIRKKGKLPEEITLETAYGLEYGEAALTIRKDILKPEDIVLIVDDVLATGGTLGAAINLVRECGVQTLYAGVLVELSALRGREKIAPINLFSTIHYDE